MLEIDAGTFYHHIDGQGEVEDSQIIQHGGHTKIHVHAWNEQGAREEASQYMPSTVNYASLSVEKIGFRGYLVQLPYDLPDEQA